MVIHNHRNQFNLNNNNSQRQLHSWADNSTPVERVLSLLNLLYQFQRHLPRPPQVQHLEPRRKPSWKKPSIGPSHTLLKCYNLQPRASHNRHSYRLPPRWSLEEFYVPFHPCLRKFQLSHQDQPVSFVAKSAVRTSTPLSRGMRMVVDGDATFVARPTIVPRLTFVTWIQSPPHGETSMTDLSFVAAS